MIKCNFKKFNFSNGKYNLTVTIIYLLFLVTIFENKVAFSATVSNLLPRVTVEELLNNGLWNSELDENSKSIETQEILNLLTKFKNEKNISLVAEMMMDNKFASDPKPIYKVKVAALRGLLQNSIEAESLGYSIQKLKKIESAWINRYLESSIAIIQQADVPEYNTLLSDFSRQVKAKSISVIDLSPLQREILDQKYGSAHGQSQIEKKNGEYLVNGAFYEKFHLLALDFSRPIGETIITFAHEIVHVSDLEVQRAKFQYNDLGIKIKEILSRSLAPKVSEQFISQVLDQVFYDIGRPELVGSIINSYSVAILNKVWPVGMQLPTQEDEAVIQNWIMALIGSTIENEFKAYSLSILVYQGLKGIEVILPSKQRERLAQFISDGEGQFRSQLGQQMSPFMRSMKNYNLLVDSLDKQSRASMDHWIHYLEAIYLRALEQSIRTSQLKYADRIKRSLPNPGKLKEKKSIDWTAPDGFDSLTNPYTLIVARVSTLRALQMKKSIFGIVNSLKDLQVSLLSLRAGVLDLHSISHEELQLLKIIGPNNGSIEPHFESCNTKSLIPYLSEKDKNKYFRTEVWSPSMLLGDHAIKSNEVLESLLKLRLLQSLGWIHTEFPDLKYNLMGVRVFISKLKEGLYDQDDLSLQRANEIEAELEKAVQSVQLTNNEISQIQYLNEFLFTANKITLDLNWSDLQEEVKEKAREAKDKLNRSLEFFGVEMESFDVSSFEIKWKESFDNFNDAIKKVEEICSNINPLYSETKDTMFKLGNEILSLKYVCFDKRTFLIRPPCDQAWVSAKIDKGHPLIRILNGSRMIEVIPYSELHH